MKRSKKMKWVKFTCSVVTPMFMAGADGRTPELRPSEFKGMMRFWWRAIRADDNIEESREEEAETFGGTGEKEGKSKVMIKVCPQQISSSSYRPLPHSQTKRFTFSCIDVNSTFKIFLKGEEEFINIFKNVLFLSTILGGFGKRSRRGFGSVATIEPKELNFENLQKEELLSKILDILNQIDNHYEIRSSKIVNRKSGGNYPWIKEIEIGNKHDDWEALLKKIGNATHNHKNPSLGNSFPRMASPIYVSLVKLKDGFYPIVTTLNSYFPQNYPRYDFSKQNDFKREVLS
jgi:CRISPR-associated protein Cmr1